MQVQNLTINAELEEVLDTLFTSLRSQGSTLFSKGYKNSKDYLMVQCPYHNLGGEQRPSAQFRKKDGLFFCHACKESHNLITVISDALNTDGRTWLVDHFDTDASSSRHLKVRPLHRYGIVEETPTYLPERVLDKYRKKHPYMYQRKLTDEIIEKFDIGFDEEENCITFPIRDPEGHLLYMATRSVKNKYFHYPSGVDKPVYGIYEINTAIAEGKQVDEVYVCESMLDALFIWCCGKYAVAMNGTGSSYQYKQLTDLGVRKLILATDNDDAGRKARVRLRANVKYKLIYEIDYESYGTCKDINDMTKEQFLNAKIIMNRHLSRG